MLKSILASSLRNMLKHKGYAIVNILGLSLGIACCVLIFSFVYHELNFDTYHRDHDRIYRVEFYRDSYVGEFYSNSVAGPVGPMLAESSPSIEKQARLIPPFENSKNVLVSQDTKRFFETNLYFADPEIFDIFHFDFLAGSAETALVEPRSLVLTKTMAEKYFGDDACIGKTLNIEIDYDYYCPVARDDYIVTAIIEDTPSNTHIPITMLMSMNSLKSHLPWIDEYWGDAHRKYAYVKIAPNAEISDLELPLEELAITNHEMYKQLTGREWTDSRYYLQPIKDIHMDPRVKYKIIPGGNWYYIRIYSLIALVVLIIGCLNFVNTSVSLGMKNIKQLGIRKIIGAKKIQLIFQFYTESAMYALLSFFLSLGLIECLLPLFNQLTGIHMSLSALMNFQVLATTFGLLIFIVFLSGSYNAFVLTKYKTQNILKGNFRFGSRGSTLQRILVVSQFTIILSFLIFSIFIYRQLDYMRGSSLGFDKEQKVVIPFKTHLGRLRTDYENIKSHFITHPNILGVTVSSGVPGNMRGGYYMTRIGMPDVETNFHQVLTVDTDFIDEFDLELLVGRPFERGGDNGYIINETGMKLLGFNNPEEALGAELRAHYHGLTKKVIGVIADFHFKGMQEEVQPLVLDVETSLYNTLTLSVQQGNLPATIKHMKTTFDELFPDTPFSYSFLDEDFDRLYKHESQIGLVVGTVAILGIVIAAIGLFGLVSFFIVQRTKEIGIRKVLGSTLSQIVTLFSLRYIKLIIFAVIIAFPLSGCIVSMWLQNFAYRISLNTLPFIISGMCVLGISILIVSLRCLKTAQANPVDALKYE